MRKAAAREGSNRACASAAGSARLKQKALTIVATFADQSIALFGILDFLRP